MNTRTSPKRIDVLGDILASGVLAAVRNPTERRTLFANAIKSGSDPGKNNYRQHWHSDRSIATKIGRTREEVNKAQARLQAKGIIHRTENPKARSRLTEIAEYADLCTIGEQHGGQPHDIRPARNCTGADIHHFTDQLLKSGILAHLAGVAAEVIIVITELVQPDPQAPDFGSYDIGAAQIAVILHRHRITVHKALTVLEHAGLITRVGRTITLQAHHADEIAQCRPDKVEQTRPFNAKARARCQNKRQEKECSAVLTHPVARSSQVDQEKECSAVLTHPVARSSHTPARGPHTPRSAVLTQTTIEPQQRTIIKNHKEASEAGKVNYRNGNHNGAQAHSHSANGAAPEDIWKKVLHELELQLPRTTFETWVRDTEIISQKGNAITVGAPHTSTREWLDKRGRKQIESILSQLVGHSVQVSFAVGGEPQPEAVPPPKDAVGASEHETAPAIPNDAQARRSARKAHLKDLIGIRADSPEVYDQIMNAVNEAIAVVKAEQLPADDEAERIDQLIDRCISILENPLDAPTSPPAQDAATAVALTLADDQDQADARKEPAPTPQAQDEAEEAPTPDVFQQAQEADRAYRQARIRHGQRWRRREPDRPAHGDELCK